MFKTIHGKLQGHDREEWLFPKMDKNRMSNSLKYGPKDVDDAMPWFDVLCTPHRTCIQAGGAMGFWPIRLAQLFDRVVSFEPHPVNYECLLHNTQGIENIESIHAALGREPGRVSVHLPENEEGNAGAYYVKPGDEVEQCTIDNLGFNYVDLIYLDIEGAETDALLGATETIAKCRPVIGLEDKKNKFWKRFGHKRSPVEMLIQDFGYQQVTRYHLDVLLAPTERIAALNERVLVAKSGDTEIVTKDAT